MPSYVLPLVNAAEDGRFTGATTHVYFHTVAKTMFEAWLTALDAACGELFVPTDLAVVHVDLDYSREAHVGQSTHEVALLKIGRTSFTFRVVMTQQGHACADMTAVVAQIGEDREHASPFSEAQRAALQRLQAA